jgi:hypothetical protein
MSNLTACIDCAGAISPNATTCPHCGRKWPLPGQKEKIERELAILPFIFAIPVLFLLGFCALAV